MRVLSVVGTRPNFMKVAPIARALAGSVHPFEHILVHTGQHYDERMSASFFEDLGMPKPDFNLEVGSGSHAAQTAAVMTKIEPILLSARPDLVLVVGDVNSTLAAALAAKKLNIRVAHVEAGLRAFDRSMPEEINRLATDAISDDLFTTDRFANENLKREGIPEHRIHFVGNVMIDSLLTHLERAKRLAFNQTFNVRPREYATLTLHRPSNVEVRDKLIEILDAISASAPDIPFIFPIHPRTRSRIEAFGLESRFAAAPGRKGIFLTEPLGYLEFLCLNNSAALVLTDSGGLQEETTILGVPCVTLRENTERPITIEEGSNHLAGTSYDGIIAAVAAARSQPADTKRRPEKWDGRAADRIVEVLATFGRTAL